MSTVVLAHGGSDRIWEWSESNRPDLSVPLQDLEVVLPNHDGVPADLLGVPRAGLLRKPPVSTRLCFLLELRAQDCALGPLVLAYSVTGEGRIARASSISPVAPDGFTFDNKDGLLMVVEAPYRDLLLWLRGDLIFGNVLFGGAEVKGDLIDFAALDGIVSAPADRATDDSVLDRLVELTR